MPNIDNYPVNGVIEYFTNAPLNQAQLVLDIVTNLMSQRGPKLNKAPKAPRGRKPKAAVAVASAAE
jgi:hypothetical protein